jgi:hypothetical protein
MSGKLSPSKAVQIGVLLELIGVAGVGLLVTTGSGWLPLAPLLFIYGIGVGLATAQLTGVIMVDVPDDMSGQGSGSQSTVRQIGSALGIAVLGTMLFSGTQASLETRLDALEVDAQSQVLIVDSVVESAGGAIIGLDKAFAEPLGEAKATAVKLAAEEAFTDGAKLSAWAAAGFLLLGFFSTFRLGSRKVTKTT